MKKTLLALTISASLFSGSVFACGEEKAASASATSVTPVAAQVAGCPMEAKYKGNYEACAKACEAAGNTECAKSCREKAAQAKGISTGPQIVAVSNVNASDKSCSGGTCMGSMAGAMAAGLGIIGLALFATKKL